MYCPLTSETKIASVPPRLSMSTLLKQLLLPPASLILVLLAGLIIARNRWDIGWWMATLSAALLYILATPLGSGTLSRFLETYPPLTAGDLRAGEARAIVILGSDGVYAMEYGGDTVGSLTLARLRYGTWLHHQTGLPILVSGGILDDDPISLAERMKHVLTLDYGIPEIWEETRSRDTWENAVNSAALLRDKNIGHVYLVAHARDMARALNAFQQAGLKITPAPISFEERRAQGLRMILPSAKSLLASYYALYEIAGGIGYTFIHPRSATIGAK